MVHLTSIGRMTHDVDVVFDIDDTQDIGRDEFGFITLVSPLGSTGQGDDSVFYGDVDGGGDQGVKYKRLEHVAPELGVFPAVFGQNADVECVVDGSDSANTFDCPLGFALLSKTAYSATMPSSADTAIASPSILGS